MEAVLGVYERVYDPLYPVLCFDERPCQLIDNILLPTPAKPGRERREDYHYKRNGTAVVLLAVEPLTGKRIVEVSRRKTKKDYARFMARVLRAYKDAKQIILVQDNLNTHSPSSFYERYPAEKAFKMTQGIQMVFTPKKASWLNMAEIEFSALAKQCLNRRVASFSQLQKQVNAWTIQRNRKKIQINWQFTNYKARTKFSRVYNEICSNT